MTQSKRLVLSVSLHARLEIQTKRHGMRDISRMIDEKKCPWDAICATLSFREIDHGFPFA